MVMNDDLRRVVFMVMNDDLERVVATLVLLMMRSTL